MNAVHSLKQIYKGNDICFRAVSTKERCSCWGGTLVLSVERERSDWVFQKDSKNIAKKRNKNKTSLFRENHKNPSFRPVCGVYLSS